MNMNKNTGQTYTNNTANLSSRPSDFVSKHTSLSGEIQMIVQLAAMRSERNDKMTQFYI